MIVANDLVHAPAATKIVSVASATATRKVAAGDSGALPHVILGPESWDQRVGTRCGCVADDANSDAFLFM